MSIRVQSTQANFLFKQENGGECAVIVYLSLPHIHISSDPHTQQQTLHLPSEEADSGCSICFHPR